MNARQKNKMQSHNTRLQALKTAPEIALIKGMPAKVAAYGRKIDAVGALETIQTERTRLKGVRDARYVEMRDATLAVAGVAMSHAEEKEIPGLADQVRVIPSDFVQARWADRMKIAQQVHAAVLPFVPELVGYGMTEETLGDLGTKIDTAKEALAPLRMAAVGKSAATAEIDVAIRKLDTMEKKQILPLLEPLKKSNPEVYRRYLIARRVFAGPGSRSDAGTDTARDTESKETENGTVSPVVVPEPQPAVKAV